MLASWPGDERRGPRPRPPRRAGDGSARLPARSRLGRRHRRRPASVPRVPRRPASRERHRCRRWRPPPARRPGRHRETRPGWPRARPASPTSPRSQVCGPASSQCWREASVMVSRSRFCSGVRSGRSIRSQAALKYPTPSPRWSGSVIARPSGWLGPSVGPADEAQTRRQLATAGPDEGGVVSVAARRAAAYQSTCPRRATRRWPRRSWR